MTGLRSLLIAVLLLASVSTQATPKTFLGNENYAPLLFSVNDEPAGLTVELAEAIFEAGRIDYSIELSDWAEAQNRAKAGEVTGLLQINKSPARLELFDFSEPVLESEFSLFLATDNFEIRDYGDLKQRRVGSEAKGYARAILERDPDINIVTIDTWLHGFEMLKAGELDALLTEKWVGEYLLSENRIRGIKVSPYPIELSTTHIAVKKGDTELLEAINRGIESIRSNGTYEAILDKWRGDSVVYITESALANQRFVRNLSIALGASCLLLLLFVVQIVRQKRSLQNYGAELEQLATDRTAHLSAALEELQLRREREAQMLSVISHELRTPLSSSHMIYDQITSTNLDEYLPVLRANSEGALAIMDDLRMVMRPDTPATKDEAVVDAPSLVIERALSSLSNLAQQYSVATHYSFDELVADEFLFNRSALRQIVTNLVKNSYLHAEAANVWVSATTKPCNSALTELTVCVEDDGKGVSEAFQQTMYEAFSRDETSGDGTGLGLYVVKELAQSLNGEISYFSSPKGGAGFKFIARLLPANEHVNFNERSYTDEQLTQTLAGKTVLVAEDQLTIQMLTKGILAKAGAEVTTASNGQLALAAFLDKQPDIVLTDAMMPEMDGYELSAQLRTAGYTGPIIAVTAATIGDEQDRLVAAGVDVVMSKPINLNKLKLALADWERHRKQSKERY
ncbi:MAG: transporter substrate-binding domain-containing protein [Oceanospirillaceae bacterium]|nr:transporter substrate-binding domain-containing protein [Oceanospirillaceae bacterium]